MAKDNPSGSDTNGGNGNQPSTEQHPVATAIKSLERHHHSTRENPTEYERQAHFWSVWTGRGVLLYTVFTAAIMVASICTAIFSRWQATTADDTEKRSLRAYVGIENDAFVVNCTACDDQTKQTIPERGLTEDNILIIKITNYGGTPASKVMAHINYKDTKFGTELPPDFNYADGIPNGPLLAPVTMSPHSTTDMGGSLNAATVDLFKRARNHQITLHIYGHVDYTDAFKCSGSILFCYRYTPDNKPEHRFPPCAKHNEPRKDCEPNE